MTDYCWIGTHSKLSLLRKQNSYCTHRCTSSETQQGKGNDGLSVIVCTLENALYLLYEPLDPYRLIDETNR